MQIKFFYYYKEAERLFYGQGARIARLRSLFSKSGAEFRSLTKAALTRQMSGDLAGSLEIWEDVLARWPQDPLSYRSIAICARNLGHLDRAIQVIDQALIRFPQNRSVIAEAAQNAQAKGDWPGSVVLWEKIMHLPGLAPAWLHMYAHALLLVGDFDKLVPALAKFRSAYPDRSGFIALEAMFASAKEEWSLAVKLWQNFRERFPNERVGWDHYGRALQELEFHRLAAGEPSNDVEAMEQAQVGIIEDESVRTLLLDFEGLGSDCEFGLVQRRYGAEPLSLLRFNAVTYTGLMLGLVNKFEGMGSAEATEMITLGNGEYFIRDRRWGLGMHTFNFVGQVDPDILYRKFCQRVGFLKGKLLRDLSEGRKIFVFYAPGLSMDDLQMLHAALQELGPVTLLHVTTVEAAHQMGVSCQAGDLHPIKSGLYMGYLRRSGRDSSGAWDIEYGDWIDICSKAKMAVAGA